VNEQTSAIRAELAQDKAKLKQLDQNKRKELEALKAQHEGDSGKMIEAYEAQIGDVTKHFSVSNLAS